MSITVVVSFEAMTFATPSLIATRDPISPANRWTKYGHRQALEVREEPARMEQRQLGLEPQQVVLLQPGEDHQHDRRHGHRHQQRRDDEGAVADQVLVDEDARERRHDQPGDDEQEAAQHHVEQREPRVGQPGPQRAQHARLVAALLEIRAGREGQHHARVRGVQLLERDARRPLGRVVEIRLAAAEALENEEMIQVPEEDDGERQVVELGRGRRT